MMKRNKCDDCLATIEYVAELAGKCKRCKKKLCHSCQTGKHACKFEVLGDWEPEIEIMNSIPIHKLDL